MIEFSRTTRQLRPWQWGALGCAAATGLVTAGCASGNVNASANTAPATSVSGVATPGGETSPSATQAPTPAAPNTTSVASMFTFNTLNGGYPDIKTYTGPGTSTNDRIVKARYTNGEQFPALCETTGRSVSSVAGEHPSRTSTEWVLIGDGNHSFATLTYGDLSGPTPPQCTPDQIPQ